MEHELFLDWSPDARDRTALMQRVIDNNVKRAGATGYREIAVVLRDPDTGEANSGIWASIAYSWLFVELLYVAETQRHQGLGSRLLAAAEKAARGQGCSGVWLITYGFQAPDFYEKNGYEKFGELPGRMLPAGTVASQICLYRKLFPYDNCASEADAVR